jgi:hypothetical protein
VTVRSWCDLVAFLGFSLAIRTEIKFTKIDTGCFKKLNIHVISVLMKDLLNLNKQKKL